MLPQYEHFEEIEVQVASVDGLLRDGQERFLFETVKRLPQDATIVEIGAFMGKSTLCMGFACLGTRRKIYSVDTWNGNNADFFINDFYINWATNVINAGLEGHAFPLVGNSRVIMPLWETISKGKKIDMLLIDGSHVYNDVLADFYNSFNHVKDNGLVFLHDITDDGWQGPDRVWKELASNLLVDQVFLSTLGGGRKNANLPRWAEMYCNKILNSHKSVPERSFPAEVRPM
ncbi:MAG: class I SAM-dependent methyltransferase [Desulfuromonadaceae bacterium]